MVLRPVCYPPMALHPSSPRLSPPNSDEARRLFIACIHTFHIAMAGVSRSVCLWLLTDTGVDLGRCSPEPDLPQWLSISVAVAPWLHPPRCDNALPKP